VSVLLVSCDNAGLTPAPTIEEPLVGLNYDGDNEDAPEFQAGTYEGAVRFPSSIISAFEGNSLVRVQYYVASKPSSMTIKIYLKTNGDAPDTEIYSAVVTNDTQANSWNEHTLTTPITIGRDDMWISVKFTQSDALRSLGCDPGPAVTNGDWVLLNNGWQPLNRASEVNINWNIRAVIDPS